MSQELTQEENLSLIKLLESKDTTNILIGIQILKSAEISPQLLSALVFNAYFSKEGDIRKKLKTAVRKRLDGDLYKSCSKIIKGENPAHPSGSFGRKIHNFLQQFLTIPNQVDLQNLAESILKETGHGYHFCLDNNLLTIKDAMRHVLAHQGRYGDAVGRFYIGGKYAQKELDELPNLKDEFKFTLISVHQPEGKPLVFPDNFSQIKEIRDFWLSNVEEVPSILTGIKIKQFKAGQNLKRFPNEVLFPNIRFLETSLPLQNSKNVINLESLSINFSTLNKLPDELLELPKLVAFQLKHVRESNYEILFETISKLSNLKVLSLDGCQMQKVPESIGQLTNLEELNLESNQLTELPKALGKLTKLTKLNISQNWLNGFPTELVDLEHIKQIEYWHCSRHGISGTPKDKEGNSYKGYSQTFF